MHMPKQSQEEVIERWISAFSHLIKYSSQHSDGFWADLGAGLIITDLFSHWTISSGSTALLHPWLVDTRVCRMLSGAVDAYFYTEEVKNSSFQMLSMSSGWNAESSEDMCFSSCFQWKHWTIKLCWLQSSSPVKVWFYKWTAIALSPKHERNRKYGDILSQSRRSVCCTERW